MVQRCPPARLTNRARKAIRKGPSFEEIVKVRPDVCEPSIALLALTYFEQSCEFKLRENLLFQFLHIPV
jgi:hypothetical protein